MDKETGQAGNWWRRSRTYLGFGLINLLAMLVSMPLSQAFRTPSIMVVNAVPIVLSGWLFGRRGSIFSGLFLYVAVGLWFHLKGLHEFVDPKGLFLGALSFGIFASVGAILATVRGLYTRIRSLVAEVERKNVELQLAVLTDPLTGLRNRRYVDEVVSSSAATFLQQLATPETALRDLSISGKVMFLLVVDIDHFKRVNDRFGHASGDKVLMEVADRIRTALRFDDTVVRWGGEEFLAVCPLVHHDRAEVVLTKVLDGVRSTPIRLEDGFSCDVTVSIGAIRIPALPRHPKALSFDRHVVLADKALYLAKTEGRDHAQLVELVPEGFPPEVGLGDSMDALFHNPDLCRTRPIGRRKPG